MSRAGVDVTPEKVAEGAHFDMQYVHRAQWRVCVCPCPNTRQHAVWQPSNSRRALDRGLGDGLGSGPSRGVIECSRWWQT